MLDQRAACRDTAVLSRAEIDEALAAAAHRSRRMVSHRRRVDAALRARPVL
jgi:hypothetical protein